MAPKRTAEATQDPGGGFFISDASNLNRVCAIRPEIVLDHYFTRLDSILARHPSLLPPNIPPPLLPSGPFPRSIHPHPPPPQRNISFIDLPVGIQARIITLVGLTPRYISHPLKRKENLHERITPDLKTLLHLATSCRTLHTTVFGMQKLFTNMRMEITLRPDVSSTANFERVRMNIQKDIQLMRIFFGNSGDILPLRLRYAIGFGPGTPTSTIEMFNLQVLPVTQLICDTMFVARWQVLDLCMPTYAPFPNLLFALAAPPVALHSSQDCVQMADIKWEASLQASKPAFTSLRILHLLAPYPPPPGKSVYRENAINAFLRFSAGAPLLSSIKLDFSAPLDPLRFSQGLAVQPFFSVNSVLALHHTAEGVRNPAEREKVRTFVRSIMKPLWVGRNTTFPHNQDFAPIRIAQGVRGQDAWWIGLKHLTLSTGITTRRLFYLLAHTIGLQSLNVWLGEDSSGNEMFSQSTLNIPLPNLTVLVVRCAADLELLQHLHTPKLEGLYIQMRYFEQCRTWLHGIGRSPTPSFSFKHILGLDRTKFSPEVEKKTAIILRRFLLGFTSRSPATEMLNPTPLPLRRVKLVALPLRDASLPNLLRAAPNLEELRVWWGLGGGFVEVLADATLVPRLSYLDLHLAKARVLPYLADSLIRIISKRGQGIKLNVTEEKVDSAAIDVDGSINRPTLEVDGFAFVDDGAEGGGGHMDVNADPGTQMDVDVTEVVVDDDMELEEGEIREFAPGEVVTEGQQLGQPANQPDLSQRSGSSSTQTDLSHLEHQVRLETIEYQDMPIDWPNSVTVSLNLAKEQCPCGILWMEPELGPNL